MPKMSPNGFSLALRGCLLLALPPILTIYGKDVMSWPIWRLHTLSGL
jgi:hypothetical protein